MTTTAIITKDWFSLSSFRKTRFNGIASQDTSYSKWQKELGELPRSNRNKQEEEHQTPDLTEYGDDIYHLELPEVEEFMANESFEELVGSLLPIWICFALAGIQGFVNQNP